MRTKPTTSTKAASLRARAETELREFGAKRENSPIMSAIYDGAKARLRKRRKNHRSEPGDPKSAAAPQRLLHELEVHQIELEIQNAELLKARDELEVALEKSTDLYDFAPVGYFSIDESGVILEANLTSAALLGVDRSRVINRRLLQFASPASRPILLAFLKKLFTGPKADACEVLLLKDGGGTFWAGLRATPAISLKGTGKWCRVAFGDITARREAEEALRASEERFRALFELGPMAVYSCDVSGVIREFNRSAAKLWGREPALGDTDERFCGSFKLFRPDGSFMPHEQCPMAEVMSGKIPAARDAEVLIERPGGSRISVIVNIRPLKNQRGEITGAINCFYDITEHKRAEQAQRRIEILAASNRKQEQEINRRQAVEKALKQSKLEQSRLLEQSRQVQEQRRHLAHQVLLAQEEERKRISRELHDVIAQTLTGINVRLAALTKGAALNTRGLQRDIALTQRLVEGSVKVIHDFARELRPSVLDDLGLIPALHTFLKQFREETGLQVSLSAVAAVEQANGDKRTVLYRVAQEALTNIARHAQASQAEVKIWKLDNTLRMTIKDDGKGFPSGRGLQAKKHKRLGLLGMRERVEMVSGTFAVQSAPGKGTTVVVQIPLADVQGGIRARRLLRNNAIQ